MERKGVSPTRQHARRRRARTAGERVSKKRKLYGEPGQQGQQESKVEQEERVKNKNRLRFRQFKIRLEHRFVMKSRIQNHFMHINQQFRISTCEVSKETSRH